MAKKTATVPERSAIIEATLTLAEERGWHAISLVDIAAQAGIGLADLHREFDGKLAILKAYLGQLDDALCAGELPSREDGAKDRLFDVIMRRFDAMQPHREAIRAIVKGSAVDPWMLFGSAPHLLKTAALMLEVAGISASGPVGRIKAKGVAVVYLAAFRTWLRDDSTDMGKTMATLDRVLSRAEGLTDLLTRGRRHSPNNDREGTADRA